MTIASTNMLYSDSLRHALNYDKSKYHNKKFNITQSMIHLIFNREAYLTIKKPYFLIQQDAKFALMYNCSLFRTVKCKRLEKAMRKQFCS